MTDTTTPSNANPPRRRSPPRRIEVAGIETLSPAMRRITFSGPELAGFGPPMPLPAASRAEVFADHDYGE